MVSAAFAWKLTLSQNRRSIGRKCITYPLDSTPFRVVRAVEKDAVEAAIAVTCLVHRKVMPCGENDAPLFGGCDAGARPAETRAAAQAHFGEHQRRSAAADEINFTALAAEVAFQNDQPVQAEVPSGQFLCPLPSVVVVAGGGMRGIFPIHG